MRLLLFVLFTICAVCTTKNLLLRFEDSVAVLREEYINGDTSHAFSIAMRLFVAT